jgi:hypothetical protein
MTTLKLKCLNKAGVLKRIGRPLLSRFFEQFAPQLNSNGLSIPSPGLSDSDFFNGLALLLMRPEELPDALNEALVAVDDLSTLQGFESLEKSPGWSARQRLLKPDSTREDIALQLWLADREFVIGVHNRLRLTRLTVFEYAAHENGSVNSTFHELSGYTDQRPPLPQPSPPMEEREKTRAVQSPGACAKRVEVRHEDSSAREKGLSSILDPRSSLSIDPRPWKLDKCAIADLTFALDEWFATNHRGSETTRIEVYPLRGEYWFLIRHGDVFIRAPKVRQQTTEILHYRPERDDVIVYSPTLDEIRVNARTQGERELYIQQFGLHLRGGRDYFSHRAPYTLEPLRSQGQSALDVDGLDGIANITLRELEILLNNNQRETITRQAEDIFRCTPLDPRDASPIPEDVHLARAIFDIQFAGARRAHPVEIRPPNILKVSRRSDPHAVRDWLLKRGFRKNARKVESVFA